MDDEQELTRRALEQARGRDYALCDLPGYGAWAKRRLQDGISPALIAHLDAMSMFLLPDEVATVTEGTFEEMLQELHEELNE